MWLFPLVAAVVAFIFAGLLVQQFIDRRRPYQLLWAVSLAMYAMASLAVAAGAAGDWARFEFQVYWALGAVLNVPFLAAGELTLLFRRPAVLWGTSLVLVFVTAYTVAVLQGATFDQASLAEALPSGKHVFGDGTPAHRLPQLISIPSYLLLVAGALWSAWRMRGRPERRDAFWGTLLIVAGASVIAGFGSAFAALGRLALFSVALLVGVAVMFAGFLRASVSRQPATRVDPATTAPSPPAPS